MHVFFVGICTLPVPVDLSAFDGTGNSLLKLAALRAGLLMELVTKQIEKRCLCMS